MDNLMIALNTKSKIPLYEQIYTHIKNEILSGAITPNTKAPSKRKLATFLQVSINTVDAAYQSLVAEGYLEPVPKKGYFVNKIDEVFLGHKTPYAPIKIAENDDYIIEFSLQSVDPYAFPTKIWQKLNKNILDNPTPELFKRGDRQGEYRLRETLAEYLHRQRGVNCHPEQLIIGGGTGNILYILSTLMGRENPLATENPAYGRAFEIFSSAGHNVIPVGIEKGGISIDKLKSASAGSVYITPSLQFPLGIVMPVARRTELLNWANEEQNRYIIEDDYNSEFRYQGRPIPSLQSLDENQKVIYIGTFSVSISPGVRVSFMILPYPLLKKYREDFAFLDCAVSIITQKTLQMFIAEGHMDRHIHKMRKLYRSKREFFISSIRENISHAKILGDNAGQHILLKLTNGMPENLMTESAKAAGIRIYPVSKYFLGAMPQNLQSTVMLGFGGLSEKEILKGVMLLKSAWSRSF